METQSLYEAEMKIMIDCDKLMERKDSRKEMKRKKEEEREMTGRKERQRCENFFITCASFD